MTFLDEWYLINFHPETGVSGGELVSVSANRAQ
jgi:hypothetical protein